MRNVESRENKSKGIRLLGRSCIGVFTDCFTFFCFLLSFETLRASGILEGTSFVFLTSCFSISFKLLNALIKSKNVLYRS